MAKNILFSRKEGRDEDKEGAKEEEKMYEQLQELEVRERERKTSKCESCVSVGRFESVAVFLCFLCEMYVCGECLNRHELHEGIKVEKKGSWTNIMKIVQKAKMESEKNERKRMLGTFVDDLMNESEIERRKELKNSHRIVFDRVDVKYKLDQTDCRISGLCGLENRRLVVCDSSNSCIKIFKLGSHVLQRYIRFVESRRYVSYKLFVRSDSGPWDVTEIDLKQNSTERNFVSGSSSDISGTDRADPSKQCLIAVTLPWKWQIMFVDLSKKPTKPQKVIQTEAECYNIQFYDDKIFTVCREYPDSRFSVYVYSTDGDKLNKFDTGIYGYFTDPYLAVVSERVYLTDKYNHKVQCRNVEGHLISEITIEGSWPAGIIVDSDNNVHVCAWKHGKVYKLNAGLTRYKSVLDQTTDCIDRPWVLCYYRDKLFIGHYWSSSLDNFVSVVRLL